MKLKEIKKSTSAGKKFMALFEGDKTKKTIHFGAAGYTDYTRGATDEQRTAYRARHAKDLKGNPISAGYLSYYILWNQKSMIASIADYKKRFNL